MVLQLSFGMQSTIHWVWRKNRYHVAIWLANPKPAFMIANAITWVEHECPLAGQVSISHVMQPAEEAACDH